jgi:hypothetical protein
VNLSGSETEGARNMQSHGRVAYRRSEA